jgi:hypothetical protein
MTVIFVLWIILCYRIMDIVAIYATARLLWLYYILYYIVLYYTVPYHAIPHHHIYLCVYLFVLNPSDDHLSRWKHVVVYVLPQ